MRAVERRRAASAGALALLASCTLAPGPGPAGPGGAVGALPSGHGTLLQEDVSLTLVSGNLQLMVTPLHESITHVTAPDTEQRLDALVATYAGPDEADGSGLFLVTFFSDRPDVRFDPEEVQLIAQGFRQLEQVMALYRFPGNIDLESDLVLVYRLQEALQWSSLLPRIQAERGRVRARAGVGGN